MILFHVSRLDSDDLRLWWRALVPAHLLRRAGVATKVVAGDLPTSLPADATTVVFAGEIGAASVAASRRAREAGLRVVLDLADTRSLTVELDAARQIAQAAQAIVAGNEALAELAAMRLDPPCPCLVVADVSPVGAPAPVAMFLGLSIRLAGGAARLRVIDAARRLRRRLNAARPKPVADGLRIVWFGDGDGLDQEGGLGELLLAAGDLVDLSQDLQFRLRVVGTSRRLFRRTIGRLPIQVEFRRLTVPTLARDLRGADLCFLPGGGDPASAARSALRADIARSLGIPVLTTAHDGLPDQPGLMLTTDWLKALRSFAGAGGTPADAPAAFDGEELASAWRDALAEERNSAAARPQRTMDKADRLHVVFLLQQFQDLDLICPVAEAASLRDEFDVHVAILTKIAVPATRRLRTLRERAAKLVFWHGKDLLSGEIGIAPGDFQVAVTASDGAGPGARYAAAFVRAANAAGAVTLNLQHGLDNTGLTYGPPPATPFNARLVLTWGGFDRLSAAADEDTRAKVIPVGCPKRRWTRAEAPDFPLVGRKFIAVFENLHWRRYDDAYRRRFVQDLVDAASAMPDLIFLLKPHMGGRWFTREHADRPVPPNLVVADPAAGQWRRFTADSVLAHATGVITTPSTIALDAARYDLPTALVAYGIPADNYKPLFRIEEAGDWIAFVKQVAGNGYDLTAGRRFLESAALPGNATSRILDVVSLSAAGRTQAEILSSMRQSAGGTKLAGALVSGGSLH